MGNDAIRTTTWRRLLAGFGAAVLVVGALATAPASPAAAAATSTITGTVSFASNTKLSLAKGGSIQVFTAGCTWVSPLKVTWKGNSYRVTLEKAGRYRVSYANYQKSAKAPYGLSSAECGNSPVVTVGTGKTVKRNLAAKANGKLLTSGLTIKNSEWVQVYDAKTRKMVGYTHQNGADLHPGSYKLAKVTYDAKKQRTVIVQVFGTRSLSISRGATVKLGAARALSANFGKKKTSTVRTFSYRAKVDLRGAAKVGQVVSAKSYGFPSKTKFTYQWFRSGGAGRDGRIAGVSGPNYRLKAADAGAWISVIVTAKRSGYAQAQYYPDKLVQAYTLTAMEGESIEGVTPENEATVGQPVAVSPATFAQSDVHVSYTWYDADWAQIGWEAAYTPTEDQAGNLMYLTVIYSKPGYRNIDRTYEFLVRDAEPLPELVALSDEVVSGLNANDAAVVGTAMTVSPAEFEAADVVAEFVWEDGVGNVLGAGSTFVPTEDLRERGLILRITYSKTGFEPLVVSRSFELEPAEPEPVP